MLWQIIVKNGVMLGVLEFPQASSVRLTFARCGRESVMMSLNVSQKSNFSLMHLYFP
jgi:hypothetical protein